MIKNMKEVLNIIKLANRPSLRNRTIQDDNTGDLESLINIIAVQIYISKLLKNYQLLYDLIKLHGMIMQLTHNNQQALYSFMMLRDLAYDIFREDVKIVETYKLMGGTLQLLMKYKEALICYKKILMYAWANNSKSWEYQAYINMSTQYFYLGDMENLRLYSERANRGVYESDQS